MSNELETKNEEQNYELSELVDDANELLEQNDNDNIIEDVSNSEIAETDDEEVNINKSRKPAKKGLTVKKVILRTLLSLFTAIVVLVCGILGVVTIINYGPSTHARDLFVQSVMESSAAKFLAQWYFSDDEIKKILEENSVKPTEDTTDANLVQVDNNKNNPEFDKNKVEVVKISSKKYKGMLMIINDPKKVFIGTIPEFGKDFAGKTVTDMVNDNKCIGGTNAGGFEDPNGVGKGGVPLGIVISQGKLKSGSLKSTYDMAGFDKEGKLHVGKMTGQQAMDAGIQEAVSFGPTLIVNGKPVEISGTAGGVNPRTAIGQRADGSVLLMVIDGRQTNSIGATYADLIKEMADRGAVNAYNLDGGTSSHMVYNGQIVTNCSSLYGTRKMPTAILVKGE